MTAPNPSSEPHRGVDMTPFQEAATSIHECYVSFRAAGFTRYEAIQLCVGLMLGRSE